MGHIPDFAGSEYGTLVEQSGVGHSPELREADPHADNIEQRLDISGEDEPDVADFDMSFLDVPGPEQPEVKASDEQKQEKAEGGQSLSDELDDLLSLD